MQVLHKTMQVKCTLHNVHCAGAVVQNCTKLLCCCISPPCLAAQQQQQQQCSRKCGKELTLCAAYSASHLLLMLLLLYPSGGGCCSVCYQGRPRLPLCAKAAQLCCATTGWWSAAAGPRLPLLDRGRGASAAPPLCVLLHFHRPAHFRSKSPYLYLIWKNTLSQKLEIRKCLGINFFSPQNGMSDLYQCNGILDILKIDVFV